MHHHGNLLCQSLLQYASSRVLLVLLHECLDGLAVERCEYLDVALGIVIAGVEPELIELIRCSALRVEPDVSALSLAELLSVRLGDEGACQSKCWFHVIAESAAYEFGTRSHVAPLVVSSQLQAHALVLIEFQEVIALQQLIGELCE